MAKMKAALETGLEAEQPKTTKAQAIRDALAADPKGMPKDIADKLTAAGLSVTANEVSQAKYLLKVAKKKKRRRRLPLSLPKPCRPPRCPPIWFRSPLCKRRRSLCKNSAASRKPNRRWPLCRNCWTEAGRATAHSFMNPWRSHGQDDNRRGPSMSALRFLWCPSAGSPAVFNCP